jgi:hypothetical protein
MPLNGDSLCLNISLWGQFLMEKRPFKKVTPKVDANIGAITGILLKCAESIARKFVKGQPSFIAKFNA